MNKNLVQRVQRPHPWIFTASFCVSRQQKRVKSTRPVQAGMQNL